MGQKRCRRGTAGGGVGGSCGSSPAPRIPQFFAERKSEPAPVRDLVDLVEVAAMRGHVEIVAAALWVLARKGARL